MTNLAEQFISALFTDRDVYGALNYCSEDICCYSSLAGHACKGKDNVLVMFAKLMDAVPLEVNHKITNILEMRLSTDTNVAYVEYDVYKPDEQCWMHGRVSIITAFQEDEGEIRYLHSSGYDIQFGGKEQVLEDSFFRQMGGFFGTDMSFWYYDIEKKRIIHDSHSIEIHGFASMIENVPESLIECGYVHPDSAADFREMYHRLKNGEKRVSADIWIKPDHMDNYWCERIVYTVIYSVENQPMIAMGVSKDVTSEKIWDSNPNNKASSHWIGKMEGTQLQETMLREDMQRQIEKAVEHREFEIFLQPKVDSRINKICGAEALIRWRHPKHGLLPPGEFIPKLEACNLMHLLDYFSFQCVCEYQKDRMERGLEIYPISSNLSLHSLSNPVVMEQVVALVTTMALPKGCLVIEATETAFVSDMQMVLRHIRTLQSMGIKISMDDFGCGNSSLAQLADMPVDELKLDRKLVLNAATTIKGNAILQSILKLTEWLKIPVVAEGMETKEQVLYLKEAGCYVCQGYYFSRPLPIQEFEQYENRIN